MQKHTVFSLHLTKSFFVHFRLSSLIIKLREMRETVCLYVKDCKILTSYAVVCPRYKRYKITDHFTGINEVPRLSGKNRLHVFIMMLSPFFH